MTESPSHRVVVIGPDGQPVGFADVPNGSSAGEEGSTDGEEREGQFDPADAIGEPAKVMRIGTMIKQLLEEVRAAPLDDASRGRLRDIHRTSIHELEEGLAPELRDELERLTLPFTEDVVPSDAELRIAQAQLVGWLEGLFHGIQTAIYAQQVSARAQFEQMRRALPGRQSQGMPPGMAGQPGMPQAPDVQGDDDGKGQSGMYL